MTGGTASTGGSTHPSGGTPGGGAPTSQSPSHGGTNNTSGGSTSSSHNRVQRSISATSSKPRRGSTGAQDPNTSSTTSAAGSLLPQLPEAVCDFTKKLYLLIVLVYFFSQVPHQLLHQGLTTIFNLISNVKILWILPPSKKTHLDIVVLDQQLLLLPQLKPPVVQVN